MVNAVPILVILEDGWTDVCTIERPPPPYVHTGTGNYLTSGKYFKLEYYWGVPYYHEVPHAGD